MLKNYFKIALRNLFKFKVHALINILGLAIGIACCLMILFYLQHELSYDKFHEDHQNIYRIMIKSPIDFWDSEYISSAPLPICKELNKEFPEVCPASRFEGTRALIRYQDKAFNEYNIFYADTLFFQTFTFPLVKGDLRTALSEPYNVLVTQSTAQKLFGEEDPIGKVIKYGTVFDLKVAGILQDVPENSYIKFDYVISAETKKDKWGESLYEMDFKGHKEYTPWDVYSGNNYVRLNENVPVKEFETKVTSWIKQYYSKPEQAPEVKLQPLADIHLKGDTNTETANLKRIYLLFGMTILILIIACFNYMNLSTARACVRSKEVGLRKIFGGGKLSLISQFLSESILITMISVSLAIGLIYLFIPYFNQLIKLDLTFDIFHNQFLLLSSIGIVVIIGIISGLYPALFMSSSKPLNAVRGLITLNPKSSSTFRNILVVLQNTISITLIICTIILYKQMDYIKTKDLGFNSENVLSIPFFDFQLMKSYTGLKQKIMEHPDVLNTTGSQVIPFRGCGGASRCWWEGKDPEIKPPHLNTNDINYNYLDFYGIELLEGRNFSKDNPGDKKRTYILNETAVKAFGWEPHTSIGKPFGLHEKSKGTVIGVVKDFHIGSFHENIEPLALSLSPLSPPRPLSVRLSGNNTAEVLDYIKGFFNDYSLYPFQYYFLNDFIRDQYDSEIRLFKIFTYSSVLAILIACLGLFGLVIFNINQRTKEIGIRKVLGASITRISSALTGSFIKWVILANVLACPLAYLIMQRWLQGFAYRTAIGYEAFLAAGLLAVVISTITISILIFKAARANPVESLRHE